jgi:transcriptional regulator with XRE-family HTH domain
MSELSLSIARKLKAKRHELGLTQQELALILGCTYQLIQHYESGFCAMPIYMLNDFALLCKVSIDWFFLDEWSMLVYVGVL